ncbi:MAG: ribulose-phosphate 3-epimerase [Clostridium sp.]|nr:ribulose-phosphate 3-epimerase [Clostridium sp.]
MIQVAPSMLSADFARLGEEVEMINRSEAAMFHLDVMDGVFVPNISFGFPVISALARTARKPLDVHLMIVNPGNYVSQVRDCGATYMNVHLEACNHLHRVVSQIHDAGMRAGVTLNPATPVSLLTDIIEDLDMVLLMSVNPGFGGQKYIPHTARKLADLRDLIGRTGSKALVEIDGGVDLTTAPELIAGGADILVAGSYVFRAADPAKAISDLAHCGE